MEKQQFDIIKKVENYVKDICINDTCGHDWYHIKRVYNNAMVINKKENANEFVITLIVLIHDLYDYKFYKGDASEKLKELFIKLDIYDYIGKDNIKNIINSAVNLGFSENMKQVQELSKEGKIAQDADRLDAMGAIAVARTFTYGGATNRKIYDPELDTQVATPEEYRKTGSKTSIGHFYDKLLKVEGLLNTQTAKNIGNKRGEFIKVFLEEFLEEWDGKR